MAKDLNDPAYFDVALELVAMVTGSYFHKINAAETELEKAALQTAMQTWVEMRYELLGGQADAHRIQEIIEVAGKRYKEFRTEAEAVPA